MKIQTARLLLRPPEPADLDPLAALFADRDGTRFTGGVKSRAEVAAWIAERRARYDRQGYGMSTAVERSSGEVVGRCGLMHWEIDGVDELEVGYALLRPFWGRGYATEAACAVRDYGLNELGHTRLISLVHPENARSIRVAERLGMTHERDVEFRGRTVRLYALSRR